MIYCAVQPPYRLYEKCVQHFAIYVLYYIYNIIILVQPVRNPCRCWIFFRTALLKTCTCTCTLYG